jgi:hypothetical protein
METYGILDSSRKDPILSDSPELIRKRAKALRFAYDAEKAFYDYFSECEVGSERLWAAEVYEYLRRIPHERPKENG